MKNEIESTSSEDSNLSMDTTTPVKPGFFDNPKKAKRVFIVFLILTIIFLLASGTLGYLYWQKDKSLKNSNREKVQNQQKADQLVKDKADLEKQIADLKKEIEDLKNASQQSSEETANKQTIIRAYTEILTYFAQVLQNHGGFTGWTEAEYQHAREIAKKTQSSNFLATVDWAWNDITGDPAGKIARFLKEIASGINDNLP